MSELEVLLERSREGILMLGLDDGDVGEGDAGRVGQMVLRRLQRAQNTATARRWAVEDVTKDLGSTSCLQGINASQTSFALQMLLQADACLHMRGCISACPRMHLIAHNVNVGKRSHSIKRMHSVNCTHSIKT